VLPPSASVAVKLPLSRLNSSKPGAKQPTC
jgi:hypothetical protein